MDEFYDHKQIEPHIAKLWEEGDYFTPRVDPTKKPFSMFLVPPNASGPMHVGNALMVAIQDILARYHRMLGDSTLWIPGIDHGGYETQVTFEKELEKAGEDKSRYTSGQFFNAIKKFVDENSAVIEEQIKRLGGSVDWTRFRFTMDESSLASVLQTFKTMVSQDLIYRSPYMVHYCASCSTLLSDVELKEIKESTPEYFIKFFFENSKEYLTLVTTRPEFLFATTHVIAHPNDAKFSSYIGKTLINPATGNPVKIIASKRKFDPENTPTYLSPFSPSYFKYDYEYTLRNDLPSRNLLDWQGKLLERYPGATPLEAREKEITFLKAGGFLEKVDVSKEASVFLCKKDHRIESIIILTWFLKFDDENHPLRQPALDAARKEGLIVIPRWREKGLLEWIGKMPDWPIARQNVWGIKIPVWYDISQPENFIIWFMDREGKRQYGNLKSFLNAGISLGEIEDGLERIYATNTGTPWILEKEPGKTYLPETDSFDTWFSSGQWATIAFGESDSQDLAYFYPSQSIVIGHDLVRLSIARKIVLSYYLTQRLPFKVVYIHRLIKGSDGRKMSKSLGNVVPLEFYLDNYGADATRMALISYTMEQDDFILSEDRLAFFAEFVSRLWKLGHIVDLANQHSVKPFLTPTLPERDRAFLFEVEGLGKRVGSYIEKYSFANAEDALCGFLENLEHYASQIQTGNNPALSLSVLKQAYKKYIVFLHPFMPFATEELNAILYPESQPLAQGKFATKARPAL